MNVDEGKKQKEKHNAKINKCHETPALKSFFPLIRSVLKDTITAALDLHPLVSQRSVVGRCFGCLQNEAKGGKQGDSEGAGRVVLSDRHGSTGLGGGLLGRIRGGCGFGGHSSGSGSGCRGFTGLGVLGVLGATLVVILAGLLSFGIGGVRIDALNKGFLADKERESVGVL